MKPSWLRFPPPLRVSIPLAVLLSGLVFLLVTAWLLDRRDRQRTMSVVVNSTRDQAERLAKLVAGLTPEELPVAENVITYVATAARVHWAALCTPDGTVIYGSQPGWAGRSLATAVPGVVVDALHRVVKSGVPEVVAIGEESRVAVQPVFDGDKPSAVRQVVLLERELAGLLLIQRKNAVSDTLVASMLLLGSCLALWGALHWFLARRVHLLVENTRQARSWGAKIAPLEGGDEFAEISRAIVESESRFQQFAATVNDVFYMVRADRSEVFYVSPTYERVWGRSVEALLQDPGDWLKAIPEEDRQRVMQMHEPLHHGAQMVCMEYSIRLPDGSLRWIENRSYPVHDAAGRLCFISGLATDITERRHLQAELLDVAERERRSIGHDLHDDLCQRLAAIKLKSEMLAGILSRGGVPDVAQAEAISAHIAAATIQCRAIARGLSPVELPGEGLMVALEKLVSATESLHEVACFFHCPHPVSVGSTATAMHLYRITQEFLNNAVRHGQPDRIDVRLEVNQEFLRIEVVNDGRPYVNPGTGGNGMGLKILQYRAGAIGATFRIQNRSDGIAGTIAVCQAPCHSCNPDPPSQTS